MEMDVNRYINNDFFPILKDYIIKKNKDNTILISKHDSNDIYLFEGTSKIILDNMDLPKDKIISLLCLKYKIDEDIVSKDYDNFINSLNELKKSKEKEVTDSDLDKFFSTKTFNHFTIEITNICPFRCDHCYVPKTNSKYMSFEKFKNIIDQLIELKVRNILITGGDPLINPYFVDMYKYAKEKGLFIHINTTSFILNDEIYNLFSNYKPNGIEISIYGYDNSTYESFVHVNNSYDHVIDNIKKLKKLGINISLKTVLTKKNYMYIGKIKALAKQLNLPYRYDYLLFPKLNEIGYKNSESISVSDVIKVIKEDKNDVEFFKNAVKNIEIIKENYKPSNKVFQCSIGKGSIFIDTYGNIKSCLVVDETINMDKISIKNAIKKLNNKYDRMKFKSSDKCYSCYKKKLCRYCPGRFYMETKSYKEPPAFYCELADKLIEEFK